MSTSSFASRAVNGPDPIRSGPLKGLFASSTLTVTRSIKGMLGHAKICCFGPKKCQSNYFANFAYVSTLFHGAVT